LGLEVTFMFREREPIETSHLAGIDCRIEALSDRSAVYWEQVSAPLALRRGAFDVWHSPAERGVPFFASCPRVLTLHSAPHAAYADFIARGLLPGQLGDYLGSGALKTAGWRGRYYAAQ